MNQQNGTSQGEVSFIQNTLKELTGETFPKNYILSNYIPLLKSFKNKKKIMIAGAQGSGKSSFCKLTKLFFKKFYKKKVVILSLDNFYYSLRLREKLSKEVHSLFQTRGVPGTHDIDLIKKKILEINQRKFPIYLPLFDKVKDNRKKNYQKINECDLLILEGWCVGAKPLDDNYLKKNINLLEKNNDPKYKWRFSYNENLKKYQSLYDYFNYFVYFRFNKWGDIIEWKYKQELNLRSKSNTKKLRKYLINFIQYYQKISLWMHKTSAKDSDILIQINSKQRFKKIIYK
tara:strand:+ start:385 stop:1248 length:864 start_codon:yes stop_codon:yes gene_type:complete